MAGGLESRVRNGMEGGAGFGVAGLSRVREDLPGRVRNPRRASRAMMATRARLGPDESDSVRARETVRGWNLAGKPVTKAVAGAGPATAVAAKKPAAKKAPAKKAASKSTKASGPSA